MGGDDYVRYVLAAMAKSLVDGGGAVVYNANGKVKSIGLLTTANTHARIIGSPSDGRASGMRFTRCVRLEETATRVTESHSSAQLGLRVKGASGNAVTFSFASRMSDIPRMDFTVRRDGDDTKLTIKGKNVDTGQEWNFGEGSLKRIN